MAIELFPLDFSPSVDASTLANFGREVRGVHPARLSPGDFETIERALYQYSVLVFRDVDLTPEEQYALTKEFDPKCDKHGHGNDKIDKGSILSYLQRIPRVPQVQLIGNGVVRNYEGIDSAVLRHPTHRTAHKTCVSDEDEINGSTRFVRWHMDAALYDLSPPRATTLYLVQVPEGPRQTCRYDDGTGDELDVSLAATAFTSGKIMFDLLSPELKSVAVRSRVRYAPHPYEWISSAHLVSTGLGVELEGLERSGDNVRPWDEEKVKVLPMLWKNPITGNLHFMTHACCASELIIEPLPANDTTEDALYPNGAHLTGLREVRKLLYKMQRPAIAPHLVYPHEWRQKDLVMFHNRGVMHSVTGNLKEDQIRIAHQCNLAASDDPDGPSQADIEVWT